MTRSITHKHTHTRIRTHADLLYDDSYCQKSLTTSTTTTCFKPGFFNSRTDCCKSGWSRLMIFMSLKFCSSDCTKISAESGFSTGGSLVRELSLVFVFLPFARFWIKLDNTTKKHLLNLLNWRYNFLFRFDHILNYQLNNTTTKCNVTFTYSWL